MGSGCWTAERFATYSSTKGFAALSDGSLDIKTLSASQVYKQSQLHESLNPHNIIRECCDSKEHPNTVPVILALDVTGSMGQTAVEVAAELNKIMTELYKTVSDVEFMIMGIGDLEFDSVPIQATQFESDIRIAEQLDQLYFEFGGGWNDYESYTAAWAFGLTQTKLDCWKRDRKGIIITMGDEELNPTLPKENYNVITGHGNDFSGNGDIDTKTLYPLVAEKFDVYHIDVNHRYFKANLQSFKELLGEDHIYRVPVNGVAQCIANIVKDSVAKSCNLQNNETIVANNFCEISW